MRNTYAQDQEIPLHYSECPSCGDRRGLPAGDGAIPLYTAIGVRSQGRESNPYWFAWRPILVTVSTYIETVVAESCALFIVLRHRASSSPICLSEVIRKPFALSRVFLLFSGGKSVLLVKKKAPSRSGFPLSMYVVLKTRHVNPNIHVRRY